MCVCVCVGVGGVPSYLTFVELGACRNFGGTVPVNPIKIFCFTHSKY